jgi:hypothetical protein
LVQWLISSGSHMAGRVVREMAKKNIAQKAMAIVLLVLTAVSFDTMRTGLHLQWNVDVEAGKEGFVTVKGYRREDTRDFFCFEKSMPGGITNPEDNSCTIKCGPRDSRCSWAVRTCARYSYTCNTITYNCPRSTNLAVRGAMPSLYHTRKRVIRFAHSPRCRTHSVRRCTSCLHSVRRCTSCLHSVRRCTSCLHSVRRCTSCSHSVRRCTSCLHSVRRCTSCLHRFSSSFSDPFSHHFHLPGLHRTASVR